MAARKSCTHLTWSEAKSKVGGSSSTSSKKPLIPKKIDHGKALTAKVIAKNGASQADLSKERTNMRRAKRGEERAAAAAARRAEEKERERVERMVKPFDTARDRMIELANKLQNDTGGGSNDKKMLIPKDSVQQMAECRELQVNELLGLDAIYNTHHDDDDAANKEFRITESSKFEELQQLVEEWQMDPENEELSEKIAQHPPLECTIQLIIDGTIYDEYFDDGCGDGVKLTSVLLLKVTLPSLYPSEEFDDMLPTFDMEYFLCTDRGMEYTPDKPLESLAFLDEKKLQDALEEEARQMSPDPCVYMVITACLTERLFDFVKLSTRGRFLLDEHLCRKMSDDEY